MTPEQKREKILKQLLPMLAIMVIYFVFISGIATTKSELAEKAYSDYFRKGISEAALPSLTKKQGKLASEIKGLKIKDKKIREEFMKESVFASHDSSNATTAKVSYILEKYQIHLMGEETMHDTEPATLSKSLRDTQHWLTDVMSMDDTSLKIIRLRFLGSYDNTFRALVEISDDQIKALPVSLTMHESPTTTGDGITQMEWVLELWV